MTAGLYIARRSPIHALSAKAKLLLLAIGTILAFLFSQPLALIVLLGIVLLLFVVARLPRQSIIMHLRLVAPLLLALFVIHGLFTHWLIGLVIVLRFVLLLLAANLVTCTTRVSDLIEAIEQSLAPLTWTGINPARVSMTLLMAIRFVPVLLDQFNQIQEAQSVRGLDRNLFALLVPFLVKTLYRADELADALDARCYDPDE